MDHLVCMPSNHFILFILGGLVIIIWALYQVNLQATQIKHLTTLNDDKDRNYDQLGDMIDQRLRDNNEKLGMLMASGQAQKTNDYQKIMDPLIPPLQRSPYITSTFDLGIPIAVSSRGTVYDNFQLIGYAYKHNKADEMFQLFGRPIYPNGNKYEYYVINPITQIKLPVRVHNDQELNTDDQIHIKGFSGIFNVEIYDTDRPRYVPY